MIFDDAGFLNADSIRKWMWSVVHLALDMVETDYSVSVTEHGGPALKLRIGDGYRSVDVDLVPVFGFKLDRLRQKHPEALGELGNLWKVMILVLSLY